MRTMNKVMIIGRLGQDPELMESRTGNPYTRLSLATDRWQRKEDGTSEEKPDWHSVFVWGADATRCACYLRKGALVYVEGTLTYWHIQKETNREYRNAISADQVSFLTNPRAALEPAAEFERLDNSEGSRNHNAVAHPLVV